ncbi:hypothetical protein CYQ88_00890 [Hydrogenovibrio sp. SC-1]|uniref:O-antigen polymerase n=1 Tax=Hydrogenovibrio sp. SC-1 TaxID=2065820 RepID=UPI000C799E76|nr:O-antigen polymerase [Hydrogenovibrio sp. SC-1]PLA75553.1 hypothetical protein CYQ88_00890 [Hydrogenovibrio sp. SC-1]
MLINPAFVFIFVWSLSLFLYTRYYSNIFLPLSDFTLNYLVAANVSVILSWLLFVVISGRLYLRKIVPAELVQFSLHARIKIKMLLYFGIFLFLLEVVYFRDLPILAVFGLGVITYQDFGIPSLHGFLNAIVLSLSMYSLYNYLRTNRKIYILYYLLTLLVPIVGMNRGGLTSMLVQSFFVILVFRGLSFRLLIKLMVFFVLFVFIFAWFGENRTLGLGEQVYDVFNISDNFPEWLPKGTIWVYMYLTSSLNNIENVINSYSLLNFEPYKAMFGLIPSFIRDALDQPVKVDLVLSAFNVSSFMPNYLSAFGVIGSLFFYFLASLFPMYIFYAYAKRRSLVHGFVLVILLHSIALSVFSDFFAIQVYVFQMLLQFVIFLRIKGF